MKNNDDIIYEDLKNAPVYDLFDEDGNSEQYILRAQKKIDGKLYFALAKEEDLENDDFGLCLVTEDGDDIVLYPFDADTDENERLYDIFGDMLFDDIKYD